ncbi:MAG: hypothetical protein ACRC4W_07845 [Treponemataceae bacterium]
MKKSLIVLSLCSLLLILFGCKSTPKQGLSKEKLLSKEEFQTLLENVEQLRDQCLAFDAGLEDESAWDNAETDYEVAKENLEKDIRKAQSLLMSLEKTYQSFLDRRMDNLSVAALEKIKRIEKMKKRTEDLDFQKCDKQHYDIGCEKLIESKTIVEKDSFDAIVAYKTITEAEKAFFEVLNAGFFKFAQAARSEAEESKVKADSVNGKLADKENYAQSMNYMEKGDTLLVKKQSEKAYDSFNMAKASFLAVYDNVLAKKKMLEEKMALVLQKIKETEQYGVDLNKKIEQSKGVDPVIEKTPVKPKVRKEYSTDSYDVTEIAE